ncbi:hypothetical protein PVAP13_8NG347500 [Panicum virgatum]|uniref:Uncharacterized protein n=1 Tax=Panicum virgatum TaxID=38727 RepID=A0A8T0PC04_PANVG|nr:hypothetical protein PVAP13_8NG347500 [Panicum virgatum]
MRSPASVFRGQVRFNFHNSSPCSGRREQQGGGWGVGARRSGRGVRELRWPAWRIRSCRRCGAGAGQRRPPRRSRHGQRRRSARGAGHAGAAGARPRLPPTPSRRRGPTKLMRRMRKTRSCTSSSAWRPSTKAVVSIFIPLRCSGTRNVCSSGIFLIPFCVSIFASSYGYGTVSHPGIALFGSLSIATGRSSWHYYRNANLS